MYTISDRHQFILDKLKKSGKVRVLDLSKTLDVSAVTIRKDLRILEDKGLLFRSHGGASRDNPYINERSVSEKEYVKTEEKNRIGKAAADLVEAKDAIIIASGTTILAMAREISSLKDLTAITASLNVALELSKHREIEIIQLGGVLRKSSYSVVGSYGDYMLSQLSCNKLFMGIDGLELDFGLTTTSLEEAKLNQKMIESAQKVIVLTDSSKFGKRGFGRICDLECIDEIVTDKRASKEYLEAFKQNGIKVTLV